MTTKTLRERFEAATGHAKKAVKLLAQAAGKVAVSLVTEFARVAILKQAPRMAVINAGLSLIGADTRGGLSKENLEALDTVSKSSEKGAAYAKDYKAKAGSHAAPARKTSFAPA